VSPTTSPSTPRFDGDSRLEGAPAALVNVRQPWIYYFWQVLPGRTGAKLLDWFIVMALVTAGVVYWGMKAVADAPIALAASAAVLGYMSFPVMTHWFPLSEFWAGCFAVCAVMAMLRNRPYIAVSLVVSAVALREIAAWVIPVYLAWWWFSDHRKRTWPTVPIVVLVPVVLYAIHAAMSPVGSGSSGSLAFWMNGTTRTLLAALRFSGDRVPGSKWAYPAAGVLAAIGGCFVSGRAARAAVFASVAMVTVLLGVFGSSEWSRYWGAVGQPTVLALSLLALGFLVQPEDGETPVLVRWVSRS